MTTKKDVMDLFCILQKEHGWCKRGRINDLCCKEQDDIPDCHKHACIDYERMSELIDKMMADTQTETITETIKLIKKEEA